jgi:probable phosphoglycerate mutase
VNAVIYTDGAVDGAPRPAPAGAGYVIIFERDGVWETARGARPLGLLRTPQEAEYHAVLWALRDAVKRGFTEVLVRTDNEKLVEQMNGLAKVRAAELVPLARKARKLAGQFESVTFEWVRRNRNATADTLSKVGRMKNENTL